MVLAKSAGGGCPSQPGRTTFMSTQPHKKRLKVEIIGDVSVVDFFDKKIIDEQNITHIGDDLFKLVEQDGHKKVLLNFRNVEFMSSAMLGKLITLFKKLQAQRGRLILCNITDEIKEVFKITKLDKLFSILDDEQVALQSF